MGLFLRIAVGVVGWLGTFAVLTITGAAKAQDFEVVINEVHYHPADDSREGEFVEIHNYGDAPADISNWRLAGGVRFLFEPATVIPPGGFLLVAGNKDLLASRYQLEYSIVAGNFEGSLDNAGESVELLTDHGYPVSFVDYGDSDPWPETPDGLGPSLERLSPLLEDEDPRSWTASITVGGTPAAENSVKIELPDGSQPSAGTVDLIGQGAEWKFFRGRTEPPPTWPDIGFDDTGWETGPAGFGYDDGDDATILDDMQGDYTTVYVRHSFELTEPDNVLSLSLAVSFDDGFVAYLNGEEVARRNAPGQPGTRVPHTATANFPLGSAPTDVVDLTLRLGLLVAGTNVLAVEGLNADVDSGDFSLHPWLTADVRTQGGEAVSLVARGETWRFFRGTEAPPADWRELSFPDASWEIGPAGFGYGDGDDATLLDDMEQLEDDPDTPDVDESQPGYLTVFCRRLFQVPDPTLFAELRLIVDYDDGFIAYLNGQELTRSASMGPAGTEFSFDEPSRLPREAGSPEVFAIPLAQDVLRDEDNVLAVVGHNFDIDSSDFSLDPALEGILAGDDDEPPPPPVAPPRDLVINEVSAGGLGTGWVELYNPTGSPVDASDRRLLLFPPALGDFSLPPPSIVQSGGTLVFDETEVGFELDDAGALILATADAEFIDAINPRTTATEHSTGRFPDGADNRRVFADPTPGDANQLEEVTSVVINEIMYHPSDANPGTEYIEFYNRSDRTVSLRGWRITRGVDYSFADDVEIAPDGYLVVARDPAAVEVHYAISGVLGPYAGRLRNDAETILVRDALGNPADRVRHADEGSWPDGTDGEGASVELVHPDLENRFGPAWAASVGEGTPGALNSQWSADPLPVVVDVSHAPVIPAETDTVRVTAIISDEQGITGATLIYELDGAGGEPSAVPMVDDGVADDGVAGNGVYGAQIPPQPVGALVAFWIRAEATGSQEVLMPEGEEGAPSPAFLYQVEGLPPVLARPLYRVLMRAADLNELRNRDPFSNVLLDCTFVANGRAYYNRGIRLRGRSARRSCAPPRSYRIQFDHDRDLHGIKRLNVNGCNVQRQWVGLEFMRRAGIPTALAWFRQIAFNGQVRDGVRIRVETLDEAFLERVLPEDDGGNLYRGERDGDLEYRGEDFDLYRDDYEKHTNEDEDDYTDVIDLCFRLDPSTTPDEDYPAAVEEVVDTDQWARYFAAFAVLGSTEGAIVLDTGDDYYLYHRPSDGRWILLPWDLDSCYVDDNQRLFRPTLESVERYLEHPRYAPDYWCHLTRLVDVNFDPELIQSRIDRIAALFSATAIQALRSFVPARRQFIHDRISLALEVTDVSGGVLCDGFLEPTGGGDLVLAGRAPGCGTSTVLVNGVAVDYDPVTASWNGTVDVAGASRLEINSWYRDVLEVARLEVPLLGSPGMTPLPAEISGTVELVPSESPYRAGNDVSVAAGSTLRVRPGVVLLFDNDATLRVAGSLEIEGSESEPVVLRSDGCGERWEGIVFLASSSANRIAFSEIHDVTSAEGFSAALVVDRSELTLESVSVDMSSGTALVVRDGGTVDVLNSTFSGGTRGVQFLDAGGIVKDTTWVDFTGTAVRAAGGGETVLLDRCGIRNCGDGVDSQSHDITILNSSLSDITGTAVRVAEGGLGFQDSLIVRCGVGVELADASSGVLSHLTLFQLGSGLRLVENTPGSGAGAALADSLIIWEASTAIFAEPAASLILSHSDTAGGAQPGVENISADPQFVDIASDDFHLLSASPCRGTGKNGTDMGALPFDPTGETNRYTLCDSNGDSVNDLSDVVRTLLFLFSGGAPPPCEAALDCNGDSSIEVSDAVFNLAYLFTDGPSPRSPYPECESAPAEECAVGTCPQ